MSRKLLNWGWSPFLITVLAVVGAIFEWPVEVVGPVLIVILIIGLVMAATAAREKRLEQLALRLNELGGHFNRRFMGDSSLSIFVVIRTLLTSDNARVWAWPGNARWRSGFSIPGPAALPPGWRAISGDGALALTCGPV